MRRYSILHDADEIVIKEKKNAGRVVRFVLDRIYSCTKIIFILADAGFY